jgi:hypothetical protein
MLARSLSSCDCGPTVRFLKDEVSFSDAPSLIRFCDNFYSLLFSRTGKRRCSKPQTNLVLGLGIWLQYVKRSTGLWWNSWLNNAFRSVRFFFFFKVAQAAAPIVIVDQNMMHVCVSQCIDSKILRSGLRSGSGTMNPSDQDTLLRSVTERSNLENFLLRSAP